MKKHIILTAALLGLASGLGAQEADGIIVTASRLNMVRQGELMSVEMTLDLKDLEVDGNRAVLLTPRIVNGGDSVSLPSVGIYGRKRYYHYVRGGKSMITGPQETVIRARQKPDTLAYHATVSYDEWMDGASLLVLGEKYGCCNEILAEHSTLLGGYDKPEEEEAFVPRFVYVQPREEVEKSRSLSGSAFIDFPVNRTDIHPEYRRNVEELARIRATIDSVRNDRDVRITSLAIKGFASPEGSYANNERLAKGRTEALRDYVDGLYHFAPGFIVTGYEPENWQGLREYVEQSDLVDKQAILDLIGSDREPDNKEWMIKSSHPASYRHLLAECYPALRRSDYRVEYVVRHFTDAGEIRRLVKEQPQKLSLKEFYVAAQDLQPGSDEFNEIFETAVRMYPDDETANLNAANAVMQRGDLKSAEGYLKKAGNTPEAEHARKIFEKLKNKENK